MNFITNCHTRCVPISEGVFTLPVLLLVAVICPKVPELTLEVGLARLVWFQALKASAWNWPWMRWSRRKSLKSEMSVSSNPGPRRELRGTLPNDCV